MKFRIDTEVRGKNVIVRLSGRIGGEASLDMYRELKMILDQYPGKNMVLDFGDVDFLDSSGLGALVAVNSSMLRQNRELTLAAVSGNIMSLLKITNLHKILSIVENAEDAC